MSIADDEEQRRPARGTRRGGASARPRVAPQAPFQSGATAFDDRHRRYLCFNATGTLVLRCEKGQDLIETEFHDTARHTRRVPLISDFLGYSLGQLSEEVKEWAWVWGRL